MFHVKHRRIGFFPFNQLASLVTAEQPFDSSCGYMKLASKLFFFEGANFSQTQQE